MPRQTRPRFKLFAIGAILALNFFLVKFIQRRTDTGETAIPIADQDFRMFEQSLESYLKSAGTYPSTNQGLEALVTRPTTHPTPLHWVRIMEEIPIDPWGTAYQYRFPGIRNPRRPDVISAGPDREFGTADDLSNQD